MALAAAAPLSSAHAQRSGGIATHPIRLDVPYQASDYAFLGPIIGSRSIVQLGESIHMTDELPRLRLGFVRYLHEELGFDVIATEGSAVNAWLAMEQVYQGHRDSVSAARAQEVAWFALWGTTAMHTLMSYIIATQGTATPLYLSSFDVQPGMSRTTGPYVGDMLLGSLSAFGAEPPDAASWRAALGQVFRCDEAVASSAVMEALAGLERWIEALRPVVASKRPAIHAAAMTTLVPTFRGAQRLCAAHRDGGMTHRQIVRDSLSASNVLYLRDRVSATKRVITWGHHSHLNHNVRGHPLTPMGERLRALDGSSLYTIGVFVGGGTAFDLIEPFPIPIARRSVPSARGFSSDRVLDELGKRSGRSSFFLDLREAAGTDSAFLRMGETRLELRGKRSSVLAKDFDGAVYIRRVHAPTFLFADRNMMLLATLIGLLLDYGALLIGLFVVGVVLLVRRRRRERRGRSTAAPARRPTAAAPMQPASRTETPVR